MAACWRSWHPHTGGRSLTMTQPVTIETTWAVLARALHDRRAVRADYHGAVRVLCPHALGWKNGRSKVLAYQAAGNTSEGRLPAEARQRWRSLFVDEILGATIAEDQRWQTADNYSTQSNCFDQVAVEIEHGTIN